MRAVVLAVTVFMLFQMQSYLTMPGWLLASAFGMLGLMNSAERVVNFGLFVLVTIVLIPPTVFEAVGRWLLAMRGAAAL